MSETVKIPHRFRGPPDSANGGYTCGVLAAFLEPGAAVEVTLRAPPPLDRPLAVQRANGTAELKNGGRLVAEAKEAEALDLEIPEPVGLDEAERARLGSPMQKQHPYPTCFVCGSQREPGDGLCVTCGPVAGRDLVAAPFETDDSMADEEGKVRPEFVWSVLDCPSGIAWMLEPDFGLSMLGRLTAELRHPVEAGREYVAVGWTVGRDGRKGHSATALVDPESGEALAVSQAVWIELRQGNGGD